MDEALLRLSEIDGLSPKDAVIARALVRNRLLDVDTVVKTASDIARESTQGLLERLTADGHLDSMRAATIERALEKKLEERRASGDEAAPQPGPPDKWTTPSGKRARLWQPRHKRDTGESSIILLDALKQRGAVEEGRTLAPTTDLEVRLAASEAARQELEERLGEMESAAGEAENHRAHVEAMTAMMETVKAEAAHVKAQAELKEDFIEQLMQELTTQDTKRKTLEEIRAKLEQENAALKERLAEAMPEANEDTGPSKKTAMRQKAKSPS
jgi:DNA repair exonuclease SbcCD ATPase subunit